MAKTETSPLELFKQSLATTTKAMAATRDLEVGFGNAPAASENAVTLRTPPRDLTPGFVAAARGEADAVALRLAHHDASAHAKHSPQGDIPREVYEAAETARIEALGANAMRGTANNLDAALTARCAADGLEQVNDQDGAPLSLAVEFLLRERLTGRALPPAAKAIADFWRDDVEAKASDPIEQLVSQIHDQPAFAKTVRSMIRDLTSGEEAGEDADREDEEQSEQQDDQDQQRSGEDDASGEEQQGASMEELEAWMTKKQTSSSTKTPTWKPMITLMKQMTAPNPYAPIIPATIAQIMSTVSLPAPMMKWPKPLTFATLKS